MNIAVEKPPELVDKERGQAFKCNIPDTKVFSCFKPIPSMLSNLPISRIPPHKQYTILFADLNSENPLGLAIEVGWRFFEWTDDGLLGARIMWVHRGESGLVYFNIGRFVVGSMIGFQAAEALQSRASYYFRILALPQIYIFAIWLRRVDGESPEPADLLMPINPAPEAAALPPRISPFEPLFPYTTDAFFGLVREVLPQAQA
jgi:hypothetical protein